ncbi:hypothetical protein PG994_000168 [Apiospora phragmitis]|uniref:Uncharacterized protein n=1 Tax=Apiospora phragmitis TaxID=2905665 RepID=A0ABR1X5H3_9PEZI
MDASTSSAKPKGAGESAASGTEPTNTAIAASKVSQRKQWNRCDDKPEGRAYTPFYGKSRDTSWCEKEVDTKGVSLNWTCQYHQDALLQMDDYRAGHSVESALDPPAIIDGADEKPQWSIGACFGSDEKTCMVYGSVYVTVGAENNQVVTGLLKEDEEGTTREEALAAAGGRFLDLYVADDDIPRPFAPIAKKSARKPRHKKLQDGKRKPKVLQPSAKLEDRITKPKANKQRKRTKKAAEKKEDK